MKMQDRFYGDAATVNVDISDGEVNRYVAKVFGWMFIGLMITCLSTVGIITGINISDAFADTIAMLSRVVLPIFLVQVFLVGFISARVAKMNPATAIVLYAVYAAVNGFTIGLFALLYVGSAQVIAAAFGVTALSFGIMAFYGMVTKSDLTKAGNLLKMGLIGVFIVMVVNIFLRSSALEFLICIVGLFVFLGLTAYDTKKIKTQYAPAALYGTGEVGGIGQQALASNLAIAGALALYLDFLNMFMFILRLFGGGGRR